MRASTTPLEQDTPPHLSQLLLEWQSPATSRCGRRCPWGTLFSTELATGTFMIVNGLSELAPLAGPKEPLCGSHWRRGYHGWHGLRGNEPRRVPGQEHDRGPQRQPAGAQTRLVSACSWISCILEPLHLNGGSSPPEKIQFRANSTGCEEHHMLCRSHSRLSTMGRHRTQWAPCLARWPGCRPTGRCASCARLQRASPSSCQSPFRHAHLFSLLLIMQAVPQ